MTLSHKLIGVVCFILSIDRCFSKKKKKNQLIDGNLRTL